MSDVLTEGCERLAPTIFKDTYRSDEVPYVAQTLAADPGVRALVAFVTTISLMSSGHPGNDARTALEAWRTGK